MVVVVIDLCRRKGSGKSNKNKNIKGLRHAIVKKVSYYDSHNANGQCFTAHFEKGKHHDGYYEATMKLP